MGKTLAQQWKEEGVTKAVVRMMVQGTTKGMAYGFEQGIEKAVITLHQTLLRLLPWRFALTEEEKEIYALHFAKIRTLDHLTQLVDHLLLVQTLAEFERLLLSYLPKEETSPPSTQSPSVV